MPDAVHAIRAFNRFYTRQIGLLEEDYLQSGLSLVEARLVFELALAPARPGDLARDLGVDAGYLSRVVARLERRRLVAREKGVDKRSWMIGLTEAGRALFASMDAVSSAQIGAMVGTAPQGELLAAMQVIRAQLGGTAPEVALRDLRVGDLGWVAYRQSQLYAAEYGFDQGYEALIARILSEFHSNLKPGRERAWIAEAEGVVVGSVFVVQDSATTARLRLLYVEPRVRGQGLGRRLVRACTDFAREAGYQDMVLWTQNNLTAARAIYAAEGYRLEKTEPHHSFGVDLVGETWRLTL